MATTRPWEGRLLATGLLLAALALLTGPASGAPPVSGDWDVTGSESYANQTITLDGNLTVVTGGNLTLENVTLEFVSPSTGRRGVTVQPGATLLTRDNDLTAATPLDRTLIRPTQASDRIFFVSEPGAYLNISQTVMSGVGYTQSPPNRSGVYLESAIAKVSNLTVYGGYFGVVFLGEYANVTFTDIVVHNNTFDGILVQGAANVSLRGLITADNGGAGVQAAGGSVTLRTATFLHNSDGLAVKFGAVAYVQSFESTANQNGVVLLTDASAYLTLGRVHNNTVNGVDARLASSVTATSLQLADNTVHVYATGGSAYSQTGGTFSRGVVGVHLRTGASVTLLNLSMVAMTGAGFDIDTGSASLARVSIASLPIGGTVVGAAGFLFFDSSLTGATIGGFAFVNSTGVILGNPTFRDNRGSSVTMSGTSTGLVTAPLMATFVNTTAVLDDLNVTGTLWVENTTLHAMRARAWAVSGSGALHAVRGGIIGDAAGASLTLWRPASVNLTQFGVAAFTLRFEGDPVVSTVESFSVAAGGRLEAANGTSFLWRNVTASGGGTVGATAATLELVGGSAGPLDVGGGATVWLRDFQADVPGSAYGANAFLHETWTVTLELTWAPAVVAPGQGVMLANATGAAVASGTSDAQGRFAAGYLRARTGTSAGVASDNPYRIDAGTGSWAVQAFANITAPTLAFVRLNDVVPPAVQVASPADGSATRLDPVVVSGTVADLESGVAAIAWSFDNASFTALAPGTSFSFNVPGTFETTYTVTVRGTDLAGNTAFATVTFTVDRTAPTITVSGPANGSTVQGPSVTLAGRTEAGALLTVNGQAVPVDGLGDFSQVLALADGLHVLRLVAVDAAGNGVTLNVTVTLDSAPPVIIVETPLNGSVLAATQVQLTGRVDPGASISVDGVANPVLLNGSFSVTAFLDAEGPNTFLLRSQDGAGNVATITWVLVRDTQPPQVSITGFNGTEPWLLNSTSPTLEIVVDEDAIIEAATGGGSNLATFSGTSALYHPVLLEGISTISINATDRGGNRQTVYFQVRVDVTPPNYTVDGGTTGLVVGNASWTVTVRTEPGAQVTVDGTPADPSSPGSGTYTATVTLREGPNGLRVDITDAAGNVRTFNLAVTLDTQAPPLTVGAPLEGDRVADATVTVTGTTEAGATVLVGGTPVTVDAAGRFSFEQPLARGSNTITVEARDAAGNSVTVTRHVTREGGSAGGPTGVDFIDDNLYFLLIALLVAVVAAAAASRGRRKRRRLDDRAAMLSSEIDSSVNLRGDLGAMDEFSPARVDDPDFESFDEFQRRQGGG